MYKIQNMQTNKDKLSKRISTDNAGLSLRLKSIRHK